MILVVFGPFSKVAHPLHEKSAKDGALCKLNKKRTGNLSVSGQTADKVVSGLFKWEKQEKEGGMANI